MSQKVRTWEVSASGQLEDGTPYVTLEDMTTAMVEAAIVAYRMGGVVGLVQQRVETQTPDEMIPLRAFVTWQAMTGKRPVDKAVGNGGGSVDDLGAVADGPAPVDNRVDEVGDGLFVDPDAEDVSSIPAALRG